MNPQRQHLGRRAASGRDLSDQDCAQARGCPLRGGRRSPDPLRPRGCQRLPCSRDAGRPAGTLEASGAGPGRPGGRATGAAGPGERHAAPTSTWRRVGAAALTPPPSVPAVPGPRSLGSAVGGSPSGPGRGSAGRAVLGSPRAGPSTSSPPGPEAQYPLGVRRFASPHSPDAARALPTGADRREGARDNTSVRRTDVLTRERPGTEEGHQG